LFVDEESNKITDAAAITTAAQDPSHDDDFAKAMVALLDFALDRAIQILRLFAMAT
jgi:hypothetical protein